MVREEDGKANSNRSVERSIQWGEVLKEVATLSKVEMHLHI